MFRRFRRGLLAPATMVSMLMLVCALALAACGVTPTANNTADGGGSTANWQHYSGAHFTLAYPQDWHEKSLPLQTNGAATTGNTFIFYSPDGTQELAVAELDGLTSAALQQACASNGTKTTIAGLPMRYYLNANGVRNYTFVSVSNIGYTLISEGPGKQPANQSLYDAMMASFVPDTHDTACK